jgi:hypothetical protein
MNLGYRPSSLLGEEFLSASIHSPLFGRLGPSAGDVGESVGGEGAHCIILM